MIDIINSIFEAYDAEGWTNSEYDETNELITKSVNNSINKFHIQCKYYMESYSKFLLICNFNWSDEKIWGVRDEFTESIINFLQAKKISVLLNGVDVSSSCKFVFNPPVNNGYFLAFDLTKLDKRFFNTTCIMDLYIDPDIISYIEKHKGMPTDRRKFPNYLFRYNEHILEVLELCNINSADLTGMFHRCGNLKHVHYWELPADVNVFNSMFQTCICLKSVPPIYINTNHVKDFRYMFANCNLERIDIKGNISPFKVKLEGMFDRCDNLKTVPLFIDSKKVHKNPGNERIKSNLSSTMFRDCEKLDDVTKAAWEIEPVPCTTQQSQTQLVPRLDMVPFYNTLYK